jgi:AP2-like factor (euAP2 lineage)
MLCRAYDQAAIKFRGVNADINFTLTDYKDEIKKVMITDQSRAIVSLFFKRSETKRRSVRLRLSCCLILFLP